MHDVIVPLEQEGTTAKIHQWYVRPGQRVAVNDPLVELETDKVTVEVPALVAGVLAEILIAPGAEARPGAVLARIDTAASDAPPPLEARPDKTAEPDQPQAKAAETRHSPAVRKALAETGLDPAGITGTGRDGRLTRDDVLSAARTRPPAPPAEQPLAEPEPAQVRTGASAEGSTFVPHDRMRLAIARNMLASVTQAPQVTAVFEADFGPLMAHRAKHKADFARDGINLSYTAYVVMACVAAMRAVPQVNSRWHEDRLEIFRDINIGIGTALGDKGLVVPVIARAQNLSLKGVAAALQDQTNRARAGQLGPADMAGGTFTISNHGVSGSLLAAPIIINQPQSAILGVGKLEKRVVVREVNGTDTIQIRPMAYVSLTIDHRALDGHQTNSWLSAFVAALEGWSS
ncbi:dihydrolipoamide acetyltransferase family protein [Paracoccus benzoatiresistens]|uniref:Dihydrolipoamide acetyltransferase component of pyruvate dehydrogenase complex n=1 Tax=Paracoccus benzoatiresistens TaxID=2997341 RepID=A0ABT4J8I3_9RHOB|nr:dihydrolipoamide acetyltransferase family protein [Paracoccus sp. EF6]MCZ0962648.1 dihydrolipoamide acetyltransferase family protein [Paracoccus sp. EF6]